MGEKCSTLLSKQTFCKKMFDNIIVKSGDYDITLFNYDDYKKLVIGKQKYRNYTMKIPKRYCKYNSY